MFAMICWLYSCDDLSAGGASASGLLLRLASCVGRLRLTPRWAPARRTTGYLRVPKVFATLLALGQLSEIMAASYAEICWLGTSAMIIKVGTAKMVSRNMM